MFTDRRGVSMITIFLMISILSIFAYTLVEMIDRQSRMRENTKKSTAIKYVAEAALSDVMNYLRVRPDRLKNLASIYEGTTIESVSSKAPGYVPEDVIGAYYSVDMPGKFRFLPSDNEKSIMIELPEPYDIYLISVTHEENSGRALIISGGTDVDSMKELYNADNPGETEISGSEVVLDFDNPVILRYIRVEYGDIDTGDINGISVYTNYHFVEKEMKTDISDALFKYIFSYRLTGNKALITARQIRRASSLDQWKVESSYSMEARFYIDSGGNLVVYDKKHTDQVLDFPTIP
ncbi:MAG: hypothetical protein ACOCWO_04110 [Candidatus Muiribacteriaceae bacterium]